MFFNFKFLILFEYVNFQKFDLSFKIFPKLSDVLDMKCKISIDINCSVAYLVARSRKE